MAVLLPHSEDVGILLNNYLLVMFFLYSSHMVLMVYMLLPGRNDWTTDLYSLLGFELTYLLIVFLNLLEYGCLDLHFKEEYGVLHLLFVISFQSPDLNQPPDYPIIGIGISCIELSWYISLHDLKQTLYQEEVPELELILLLFQIV